MQLAESAEEDGPPRAEERSGGRETRAALAKELIGSRVQDRTGTAHSVERAMRDLAAVCLSSYGPGGRWKLIQKGPDGGTTLLSSLSSRVLEFLEVTNPAAKVLVELVGHQQKQCGDGGLFALSLAAELVAGASALAMPRHALLAAHDVAAQWTSEYLDSPTCACRVPLRWSDARAMAAVVRAVLAPKGVSRLSHEALSRLCTLVLRAFVSAIPSSGAATAPVVRTLGVAGRAGEECECVEGAVLVDVWPARGHPRSTPSPPPRRPLRRQPRAAPCARPRPRPLRPARPEPRRRAVEAATAEVEWRGGAAAWSVAGARAAAVAALAARVEASGARILLCQRVIDPALQETLHRRGVLCLERLSLRHVAAVQGVTGTLLLCAPDESAVEELQAAVQGALAVLTGCLTTPAALAGPAASRFTSPLTCAPRRSGWRLAAGFTARQIGEGVRGFAGSLERVAGALAQGAGGLSWRDAADQLAAANRATLPPAPPQPAARGARGCSGGTARRGRRGGGGVGGGRGGGLREATVLEALQAKRQALLAAKEAAAVLLRASREPRARRNVFLLDPADETFDRIHVGASCPREKARRPAPPRPAGRPRASAGAGQGAAGAAAARGVLVTPCGCELLRIRKDAAGRPLAPRCAPPAAPPAPPARLERGGAGQVLASVRYGDLQVPTAVEVMAARFASERKSALAMPQLPASLAEDLRKLAGDAAAPGPPTPIARPPSRPPYAWRP
eukprot:tig00001250_g7800.t1